MTPWHRGMCFSICACHALETNKNKKRVHGASSHRQWRYLSSGAQRAAAACRPGLAPVPGGPPLYPGSNPDPPGPRSTAGPPPPAGAPARRPPSGTPSCCLDRTAHTQRVVRHDEARRLMWRLAWEPFMLAEPYNFKFILSLKLFLGEAKKGLDISLFLTNKWLQIINYKRLFCGHSGETYWRRLPRE